MPTTSLHPLEVVLNALHLPLAARAYGLFLVTIAYCSKIGLVGDRRFNRWWQPDR